MDTLEKLGREGIKSPFEHASEHQPALTCLCSSFVLLSETVNDKKLERLLCCLREHLPYLRHFLSTYQFNSVIRRERECFED